jgi:Tfp pilus assembly protein PilF
MRAATRFQASWLAAALLFAAGCGGAKSSAKTPTGPAPVNQTPENPAQAAAPPLTSDAQGAYQQGLAAYNAGDLPAAKLLFQQVISADPRAYQAQYSLGVVLEHLGDPGALAAYRQAATINPTYEQGIAAYAIYLGSKGNFSEAESFLQTKRGAMPNSAGVIAALAEIKSMQRDTGSAQQLAQEALKKNADYRPAMVTIARDHYRNRRLDLALYALQAILDGFGDDNPPRDRDNGDAHYLRALILKEEGRRAAAINEFKAAVTSRPDLVGARVELASYYLEAGNAADAQPLLEGALRYDPNNVIAHLNLGDCYRLAGRMPEAKAQFDWVLAHDTSLAQVHYDLGLLYLFSPPLPGGDAKRQTNDAISEITKYQQMRGKLGAGQSDDSDELLNRAKQKLADIDAQASANAPAEAPAAGSAPAAAGSAAPATSAAPASPAAPAQGAQ